LQTLLSILLIVQFLIVVSHDWLDIPGWVNGSRVQAIVGRRKLLAASIINAVFPGVAVAFAIVFWSRRPAWYAPTYWVVYCAITVISAIAMWYVPYWFGACEPTCREYTLMYANTRQILPPRGDNPRPNLFHILLHILFATTLALAVLLRFGHGQP
jgi:hypothetical protein